MIFLENREFKWNSELTHSFVKLYADTSVADVRIFDQDQSSVGLTNKEMTYIYSIGTIKNCTAKDLVKLFGVSKSMVSQVISNLEKKKMIVRKTDEEDRRVSIITLSEQSTIEFSKKVEIIGKAVDGVRAKYSDSEVEVASKILNELSSQIVSLGLKMSASKNA